MLINDKSDAETECERKKRKRKKQNDIKNYITNIINTFSDFYCHKVS